MVERGGGLWASRGKLHGSELAAPDAEGRQAQVVILNLPAPSCSVSEARAPALPGNPPRHCDGGLRVSQALPGNCYIL
jgi:hypothetical protein